MKPPALLAGLALALAAASCSSQSGGGADKSRPAAAPQRQSLSQRMNDGGGYSRDADGNWVPSSNRRSSFDGAGRSPYFKGQAQTKEYRPGDYKKSSWWGRKDHPAPAYAGDTDGGRFQTASRHDGKESRETGASARVPDPYRTGTFGTSAASEAGESRLEKGSNDGIENRRQGFVAPPIIDWHQQHSLTVEDTSRILGR